MSRPIYLFYSSVILSKQYYNLSLSIFGLRYILNLHKLLKILGYCVLTVKIPFVFDIVRLVDMESTCIWSFDALLHE